LKKRRLGGASQEFANPKRGWRGGGEGGGERGPTRSKVEEPGISTTSIKRKGVYISFREKRSEHKGAEQKGKRPEIDDWK